MIIYKDIVTGDEVLSDSYPIKEVDGTVYEADCALTTIGGESIDIGANPSAEEGEEGVEDQKKTVNNIVYSFRLQQTSFDKKSYVTYLKGYMKSVKSALTTKGASNEEVKDFETKASAYVKKIVSGFNDYEFFTGESMNPDGMVVLLNYRDDGVTPYITVWKHGLSEMKV